MAGHAHGVAPEQPLARVAAGGESWVALGARLGASVALHRMDGYVLKYATNFKDTHMQRVGVAAGQTVEDRGPAAVAGATG